MAILRVKQILAKIFHNIFKGNNVNICSLLLENVRLNFCG